MNNEPDRNDDDREPLALEYRSPHLDTRRFWLRMRTRLPALLIAALFVGLAVTIYFYRLSMSRERAAAIAAMQRAIAQNVAASAANSRAVDRLHYRFVGATMRSTGTQPTTRGFYKEESR